MRKKEKTTNQIFFQALCNVVALLIAIVAFALSLF